MTEKKEKCGLFAARSSSGADVVPMTLQGLEAQQHRGQESWGISVPGKPVFTRMGLVTGWHLEADTLSSYSGKSAIGHVRYSTTGRSVIENAQPIQVGSEFSIAHNGTLVNADEISASVAAEFGRPCESDTLAAGLRLQHFLQEGRGMFEAFRSLSVELVGAYCFAILDSSGMIYVARDPRGYRPLCLGWQEDSGTFVAASESCALASVGADFIRDVEPGEIVRFGDAGVESFVITADHGHQFSRRREEDMRIESPGGDTVALHRRCWAGRGGTTPPGTVRVTGTDEGSVREKGEHQELHRT